MAAPLRSLPGTDVVATSRLVRVTAWVAVVCGVVDLGALFAHVLELPNKLKLSGPLWLAVQQNLYQGWGPALAPFEVGAVVSAWLVVVLLVRDRHPAAGMALLAAVCLTSMLALFFVLVEPVNRAVSGWTPTTLPSDWPDHRLRWEIGHGARAVLAFTAILALRRSGVFARPGGVRPANGVYGRPRLVSGGRQSRLSA